ncbi:MAG: NUDIX hydrolase [Roseburia sp.]|nr:NUDIX hydrolase [Roseburia sp.]
MDNGRDRNGKTEEEFLRSYDATKFFRPSVTVDAVLFEPTERGAKVLLIKRGGHPFLGKWAFPGGFVEQFETCETAAYRELFEETGVKDVVLRQLVTVSTVGRDPRCRNITSVYCGRVCGEVNAVGGDDADAAKWFDVEYKECGARAVLEFSGFGTRFSAILRIARDAFGSVDIDRTAMEELGSIAFDHAKIIAYLLNEYALGRIPTANDTKEGVL